MMIRAQLLMTDCGEDNLQSYRHDGSRTEEEHRPNLFTKSEKNVGNLKEADPNPTETKQPREHKSRRFSDQQLSQADLSSVQAIGDPKEDQEPLDLMLKAANSQWMKMPHKGVMSEMAQEDKASELYNRLAEIEMLKLELTDYKNKAGLDKGQASSLLEAGSLEQVALLRRELQDKELRIQGLTEQVNFLQSQRSRLTGLVESLRGQLAQRRDLEQFQLQQEFQMRKEMADHTETLKLLNISLQEQSQQGRVKYSSQLEALILKLKSSESHCEELGRRLRDSRIKETELMFEAKANENIACQSERLNQSLRSQLNHLRSQNSTLKARLQQAEDLARSLELRLYKFESECKYVSSQKSKVEGQLAQVAKQVAALKTQNEQVHESRRRLEQSLREADQAIQTRRSSLNVSMNQTFSPPKCEVDYSEIKEWKKHSPNKINLQLAQLDVDFKQRNATPMKFELRDGDELSELRRTIVELRQLAQAHQQQATGQAARSKFLNIENQRLRQSLQNAKQEARQWQKQAVQHKERESHISLRLKTVEFQLQIAKQRLEQYGNLRKNYQALSAELVTARAEKETLVKQVRQVTVLSSKQRIASKTGRQGKQEDKKDLAKLKQIQSKLQNCLQQLSKLEVRLVEKQLQNNQLQARLEEGLQWQTRMEQQERVMQERIRVLRLNNQELVVELQILKSLREHGQERMTSVQLREVGLIKKEIQLLKEKELAQAESKLLGSRVEELTELLFGKEQSWIALENMYSAKVSLLETQVRELGSALELFGAQSRRAQLQVLQSSQASQSNEKALLEQLQKYKDKYSKWRAEYQRLQQKSKLFQSKIQQKSTNASQQVAEQNSKLKAALAQLQGRLALTVKPKAQDEMWSVQQKQLQRARIQIQTLRLRLMQSERVPRDEESELRQAREEVARLRSALKKTEFELRRQGDGLDKSRSSRVELNQVNEQIQILKLKLIKGEEDRSKNEAKLYNKLVDQRKEYESCRLQLEQAQAQLEQANFQLARERRTSAERTNELNDLKAQLQKFKLSLSRSRSEQKRNGSTQNEALEQELAESRQELELLRSQLAKEKRINLSRSQELDQANEQLLALRKSQATKSPAKSDKSSAENEGLRIRVRQLEQELRQLREQGEGQFQTPRRAQQSERGESNIVDQEEEQEPASVVHSLIILVSKLQIDLELRKKIIFLLNSCKVAYEAELDRLQQQSEGLRELVDICQNEHQGRGKTTIIRKKIIRTGEGQDEYYEEEIDEAADAGDSAREHMLDSARENMIEGSACQRCSRLEEQLAELNYTLQSATKQHERLVEDKEKQISSLSQDLDRLRSDFNAKSKKLERMQQNMKKLEANYQKSKEGTEEEASRKSVEVREEEEEGEFRVAKRVLKTYQSSSQVLAQTSSQILAAESSEAHDTSAHI